MRLRLEDEPHGSEPDACATAWRARLEHTVSTLNALSRAGLGARDVVGALDAVVEVVAKAYDGAPAAVLLAEGEPPGLIVAATACLPYRMRRVLQPLAHPGHPLTVNVLAGRWWEPVTLCGLELFRLPARGRALGLLALGPEAERPADDGPPSLRSQIAEQVGLVLAHALAINRINDLEAELRLAHRRRQAETLARNRLRC